MRGSPALPSPRRRENSHVPSNTSTRLAMMSVLQKAVLIAAAIAFAVIWVDGWLYFFKLLEGVYNAHQG